MSLSTVIVAINAQLVAPVETLKNTIKTQNTLHFNECGVFLYTTYAILRRILRLADVLIYGI